MDLSDFRADLVRRMRRPVEPPPTFFFGKYRGQTVDWVLDEDPSYLVWCWRNVEKQKLPFGYGVFMAAKGRSHRVDRRRIEQHVTRYGGGGGLFSQRFSEPFVPYHESLEDLGAEMDTSGSEFQFEDLTPSDMLVDDPMEIWCSMEPWGSK